MADVSHTRGDLAGHPDATEMQARYDRVLGGRDVVLVDGPVFLVGLYCAASPWIVHYTASQSALVTHNLIVGIAIAAAGARVHRDAGPYVRPERCDVRDRRMDDRGAVDRRHRPGCRRHLEQRRHRWPHVPAGGDVRRRGVEKPPRDLKPAPVRGW